MFLPEHLALNVAQCPIFQLPYCPSPPHKHVDIWVPFVKGVEVNPSQKFQMVVRFRGMLSGCLWGSFEKLGPFKDLASLKNTRGASDVAHNSIGWLTQASALAWLILPVKAHTLWSWLYKNNCVCLQSLERNWEEMETSLLRLIILIPIILSNTLDEYYLDFIEKKTVDQISLSNMLKPI